MGVKQMSDFHKKMNARARKAGIKFGMYHSKCDEAANLPIRIFLAEIDFIICNDMPDIFAPGDAALAMKMATGAKQVAHLVSTRYEKYKPYILAVNPKIEIIIQTGRVQLPNSSSEEAYSIKNTAIYWKAIADWSEAMDIGLFLNEAFDEPWKSNPKVRTKVRYGISEQGWWRRVKDGEKESIIEKISGKTEVILSERKNISPAFVVIIAICSTTAVIGLIAISVFTYRKYFQRKSVLTNRDIVAFYQGACGKFKSNCATPEDATYDKAVEIPESELRIDKSAVLGSGQFGIVYKGNYNGKTVAVKALRPEAEKEYVLALLSELKVMIFMGIHPNLVTLIGAQTKHIRYGTLSVLLEFCGGGSLHGYLVKNQKQFVNGFPENMNQLLGWAYQICSAMEFMENKKVIHADLAIRNVLLTNDLQAKVGDFGLSRKLYQYAIYQKNSREPLPWRWMAPESLKRMEFSNKSDVWSFGVTLWEIYTLGEIPYPGMNYTTKFVKMVGEGLRLHKPALANDDMFQLMVKCWMLQPECRPSFSEFKVLVNELGRNKIYANEIRGPPGSECPGVYQNL